MLGEHYVWSKEIYFDQAFRVPLVIRDPRAGATRGTRVTQLTEAIDVAPTILERIGGMVPRAMDGRSLAAVPRRARSPERWRTEVFFEHDFRDVVTPGAGDGARPSLRRMLLRGDARRTLTSTSTSRRLPPLLFDMRADPHETTNLAEAAGDAGRRRALRYASRLLTWRLTRTDRTLTNMALTPDGVVERR